MIFPKFLKKDAVIGITAPSFGLDEKHIVMLERALSRFSERGWRVRETANVRSPLRPSAFPEERAAQLHQLIRDPETDAILCASGGDFLVELLPYLDLEAFAQNPKWVQGYSDPTGLLFPLTTKLDLATVYGLNASGFGNGGDHIAVQNALDLLEGKLIRQQSFPLYAPFTGDRATDGRYVLSKPTAWLAPGGAFSTEGRLIGGCLDVMSILQGTPFEDAAGFARRHEAEGLIWYFDIFAMQTEQVFYALWSMKQAGWFIGANAFLFGRVAFPGSQGLLADYEAAVRRALGEVPFVLNADIGHVSPCFTLINGAMARISVSGGTGSLEMELR